MILEGLSYEQVSGGAAPRDPLPVLYALSTCGFCMRAMEYLRQKGVSFRYVYFDKLDGADKERVREMIRRVHLGSIMFPVLFLSSKKLLVGFQKEEWERALA